MAKNVDDLLARLHSKGVHFIVNVPTVYGGNDIFLTPDDLVAYDGDPISVAAKHMGVTSAVYREWIASEGMVQCAGKTKSGATCKNYISGGSIYEAASWERAVSSDPRCAVHGGEEGAGKKP